MILPGIIALAVIPGLGGSDPNMEYNNAIPLLIDKYLPNGMLGIALTGLMASFMAGVAANVSAFNTVVTTDLVEPYIRKGESDEWYVRFGRIATVVGIVIGIGTALIASLYDNLMNYLQALFSIFNAPLFATFIIGMFWKRMTPPAAPLGPDRGHAHGGGAVHRLQGRLDRVRLGPRRVDVGRGLRVRRRPDRHRRRHAVHEAQAGRGAAGPRLRHGERRRGDARRSTRWWESPKLLRLPRSPALPS